MRLEWWIGWSTGLAIAAGLAIWLEASFVVSVVLGMVLSAIGAAVGLKTLRRLPCSTGRVERTGDKEFFALGPDAKTPKLEGHWKPQYTGERGENRAD